MSETTREVANRIVAALADWPSGGKISDRYDQLLAVGHPPARAARLAKTEFVERAIKEHRLSAPIAGVIRAALELARDTRDPSLMTERIENILADLDGV